jgi:hypothetical protein
MRRFAGEILVLLIAAVLIFPAVSSAESARLLRPIAKWQLDGNWKDRSKNHLDLSTLGGIGFGDGVIGDAASYDWVDDAAYRDYVFKHPPAEMTLELWAYPTGGDPDAHMIVHGNGGHFTLEWQTLINKFIFSIWNNGWFSVSPPTSQQPNQWYHVVATYKKSTGMDLYLNGQLVASRVPDREIASAGSVKFGLGGYVYSNNSLVSRFSGLLDEVSIYDKYLSPAEVMTLYESYQ